MGMKYVITINTEAYKPMKFTEKTWEKGTINDFMAALNGYRVTEYSWIGVQRRVYLFRGVTNAQGNDTWEAYKKWFDNPRNKTRITYRDEFCGFDRTQTVSAYGIPQGGLDVGGILQTLKVKGVVRIPFSACYDTRQALSRVVKGCYMQIEAIKD